MGDAENGGSTKGWLDRIYSMFSGEPRNQEQLLELLKNLQNGGLFTADELTMIEGVLQVDDMQVRDIMIPRGQMVVIDHEDSFAEITTKITESGHSRFPVVGDSRDEVEGILLAKDLLAYFAGGENQGLDLDDAAGRVSLDYVDLNRYKLAPRRKR